MERDYIEDAVFDRIDFTLQPFPKGAYEHCRFEHCVLPAVDLSGISFAECHFNGCNLGMAKTNKTAFSDVRFRDCKLLGLRFDACSDFLFAVHFENCVLDFASFYGRTAKGTKFTRCSLQEADFTGADLSAAAFDHCDLARAVFADTILERADFRTAFNYSIDPAANRLRKAKFSLAGIPGLLDRYGIEIS